MIHDHKSFAASAYNGRAAEKVRQFMPLVRRQAWHVHGSGVAGIELEDLVQAGAVALCECVQRHKGESDDGFAAYAKMRVRGAMIDLVRRTVPLARSAAAGSVRFVDIADAGDDDPRFADDAPDAFEQLSQFEQREHLFAAIGELPERLRLVVQLYFVEELSLAEIAAVLSISIPRVHQLKARALESLREAIPA
jgi:RNA polymerase sigma factor for flagellar operon FliA